MKDTRFDKFEKVRNFKKEYAAAEVRGFRSGFVFFKTVFLCDIVCWCALYLLSRVPAENRREGRRKRVEATRGEVGGRQTDVCSALAGLRSQRGQHRPGQQVRPRAAEGLQVVYGKVWPPD